MCMCTGGNRTANFFRVFESKYLIFKSSGKFHVEVFLKIVTQRVLQINSFWRGGAGGEMNYAIFGLNEINFTF